MYPGVMFLNTQHPCSYVPRSHVLIYPEPCSYVPMIHVLMYSGAMFLCTTMSCSCVPRSRVITYPRAMFFCASVVWTQVPSYVLYSSWTSRQSANLPTYHLKSDRHLLQSTNEGGSFCPVHAVIGSFSFSFVFLNALSFFFFSFYCSFF